MICGIIVWHQMLFSTLSEEGHANWHTLVTMSHYGHCYPKFHFFIFIKKMDNGMPVRAWTVRALNLGHCWSTDDHDIVMYFITIPIIICFAYGLQPDKNNWGKMPISIILLVIKLVLFLRSHYLDVWETFYVTEIMGIYYHPWLTTPCGSI